MTCIRPRRRLRRAMLMICAACADQHFSEIVPHTMSVADMLAKVPPSSVRRPVLRVRGGAHRLIPRFSRPGCRSWGSATVFQTIAHALGGTVVWYPRYGAHQASVSGESCLTDGTPRTRLCG